jgi:hypothetical protein
MTQERKAGHHSHNALSTAASAQGSTKHTVYSLPDRYFPFYHNNCYWDQRVTWGNLPSPGFIQNLTTAPKSGELPCYLSLPLNGKLLKDKKLTSIISIPTASSETSVELTVLLMNKQELRDTGEQP